MKLKSAVLLFGIAWTALAHEVPDDVRIHLFAKPSGNKMQLIVRVPANAFIDNWLPTMAGTPYLDLPQANAVLPSASETWVADLITIYEGDTRLERPKILTTMLSRQSDTSINSFGEALAHVTGPGLPANALVTIERAVADVLLEVPIRSDRSDFTFVPRFERLGVLVTTTVGFLPPGGGVRTYEYEGDPEPFKLDPSWDQSAAHFIEAGFLNIFDETDHFLLLFCAVLLFRKYRALIPFAVAFTIAHSLAFLVFAFDWGTPGVWVPPLAGTLMALGVVYLALEYMVKPDAGKKRLFFAASSGIAYGAGFWFSLRPVLQFGGEHPVVSILSFNLGIEFCQLLVLALLVICFSLITVSRTVAIILAGIVAHMAWHRMTERAFALNRFESQVQWPVFDLKWVLTGLIAAAAIWMVYGQRVVRNAAR